MLAAQVSLGSVFREEADIEKVIIDSAGSVKVLRKDSNFALVTRRQLVQLPKMLRRSVASLPGRLITHRGTLYRAGSLSLPGRFFHTSLTHNVVKPYLLADIGEGKTPESL
jgi:hypothetical protein